MLLRSTLASALLFSTAALAEQPLDLGRIYVSSQLTPVSADRTGAPAYATQATSTATPLAQTLAATPGLTFAGKGPLGQQSGFTLRGASQNYVPVYFEGIEISDPSAPQSATNLGAYAGAGLSRIEVLAGSQSALYGRSAIGGVIALEGPRPETLGTEHRLRLEAGSFDTAALSYGYFEEADDLLLTLTLDQLHTNGYSAQRNGTEADGTQSQRLGLHLEKTLQNGLTLGAVGYALRAQGDFDDWQGDADYTYARDEAALRLFVGFDLGAWAQEISASRFMLDRSYQEDAERSYTGTRDSLKWTTTGALSSALSLTGGAQYEREDYSEASQWSQSAAQTHHSSLFTELSYAARNDLDLTVALRQDDHSRFVSTTTARFAAAWRLGEDWILRGQAGSGQRTPSGYELFGPYGNEALLPETSQSSDFSLERQFGTAGFLRATAFHLQVDNLIDWEGSAYAQINGLSERRGVEVVGEYAASDRLTLKGHYTHTDFARNGSSAWADGTRNQLSVSAELAMSEALSGELHISHAAGRGSLEDYTLAHANFTYDLGNEAALSLRIENLTDADYTLVDGYGTAGRSAYVSLEKRF